MGFDDKLDSAKDKAVGKTKDAVGDATDNQDLQAEGKTQEAQGHLKSAVENVKDAFK